VLFDATGEGNNINLSPKVDEGYAFAINSLGQIVGYVAVWWSDFLVDETRAMLFDATGHGDNIEFEAPDDWGNAALSINNAGQVVGITHLTWFGIPMPHVTEYATLFDPTGSGHHVNLGGLGGNMSEAWSINNAGQIVGWGRDALGRDCAVLFDPSGGGNNINLNDVIPPTPSWRLWVAKCINDSGWIVGEGKNPEGRTRAFLLTPVSTDDFTLRLNVEPNDVGIDTTTPLPGEHISLKGRAIDLEARLFKSCPAVYHFNHWEGDVVDPNSSLTTVIMDEDKMVTAVFVASEPVCGDECHPILRGDLNGDCYINFVDFVLYSDMWMTCTHPDCD